MSLHGDMLVEPVESIHTLESVHLQDISTMSHGEEGYVYCCPHMDTDASSSMLS